MKLDQVQDGADGLHTIGLRVPLNRLLRQEETMVHSVFDAKFVQFIASGGLILAHNTDPYKVYVSNTLVLSHSTDSCADWYGPKS